MKDSLTQYITYITARLKTNIFNICLLCLGTLISWKARRWGMPTESAIGLSSTLMALGIGMIPSALDRISKREDEEQEKLEQVSKIKALVVAELHNLATHAIRAEESARALVNSKQDFKGNFRDYAPPPMPYTEGLGEQITLLNKGQLKLLVQLNASSVSLAYGMNKDMYYGMLRSSDLLISLHNFMSLLAEVIDSFAGEGDEGAVTISKKLRDIVNQKT